MNYINEWLGKIIRKCGIDIIFEFFKALCSVACAFITQNIWLTLIYIFGTTLFDIFTRIYNELSLDKIINKIFKTNNVVKYIIFIGIAVSPTFINFCLKETDYSNIVDFIQKRLHNLVPNLFGALIVCSFIKYLSKFEAEEILCAAIILKKELFDIIMRCGFMIAFLNAINHAIRNEQKCTEIFNVIHLCVIIFSGIIMFGAFALWLSSKNEFDLRKTKIYPTSSLIWCFCFLLSCIIFPIVFKNVSFEWLLLCFNAVTSLIVACSFLTFIKRKKNVEEKDCPYFLLIILSLAILGMIIYSIIYGITYIGTNEKSSIIRQLISGLLILFGSTIMLLIINGIQKKSLNLNT